MKIALIGSLYNLWSPLTPDVLYAEGRMIGGGETNLIRVSQELAQRGHQVTVYAHTPKEAVYDGVQWVPLDRHGDFLERPERADVAVSYDQPVSLNGIEAHVKVLANQTNDPSFAGLETEIDAYQFCSHWHSEAVRNLRHSIPPERCHVIGNGVDLFLYEEPVRKVQGRMIWTSSPDRGLHTALAIFAQVHERLPETTMEVYYDFHKAFDSSMWAMDYRTETLWRAKRLLDSTPGVHYVGPVDKRRLARAQQEAEILLFPEETARPSEGFCISVLEALAAGCVPLISDCDALPELWGKTCPMLPLPIQEADWREAVRDLLTEPVTRAAYQTRGRAKAMEYTWKKIGAQWDDLLRRLYREKPCPCCGRAMEVSDG